MADDMAPRRRAGVYLDRARRLAEAAAREWREDERRRMLDLAATYRQAADAMDTRTKAQRWLGDPPPDNLQRRHTLKGSQKT